MLNLKNHFYKTVQLRPIREINWEVVHFMYSYPLNPKLLIEFDGCLCFLRYCEKLNIRA